MTWFMLLLPQHFVVLFSYWTQEYTVVKGERYWFYQWRDRGKGGICYGGEVCKGGTGDEAVFACNEGKLVDVELW